MKIVVNLILVVKALLSYPLPFFASVELLESSIFVNDQTRQAEDPETMERKRKKSISFETKPLIMSSCFNTDGNLKYWAIILRVLLILFTLFLAIYIPHFAILMGLIGSITGTSLSLIWPCYFHIYLKRKSLRWFQIAADVFIIIIGIIISITGVFYSSYALSRAINHQTSLIKTDSSSSYYMKIDDFNITSFHVLKNFNTSLKLT